MSPSRPTSPLSLQPLSPSPSDTIFWPSDFESETDDASRVAKRRRIERLGRDYLEGKPLFIFSATLQGPFEEGWVNPWKKSRRPLATKDKHTQPCSEASQTHGAAATPASRADERSLLVSPDSGGKAWNSQQPQRLSGIDAGYQGSEHHTNGAGRTSGSPAAPKPGLASTRSSGDRHQSRPSHTIDTEWLKRDQKTLDYRAMNRPRSPSPTPTARSLKITSLPSKPAQTTARLSSREFGPSVLGSAHAHVSGFTPINHSPTRKPKASMVSETAKPVPRPKQQSKPAASVNVESQPRTSPPATKPMPHKPKLSNINDNPKTNTDTAPTADQIVDPRDIHSRDAAISDSFQYHRVTGAPRGAKQKKIVSKVTKLESGTRLHQKPTEQKTGLKKPSPQLQLNTTMDPLMPESHEAQDQGSTTTIANLPSAQIVPDQPTFQNQLISLYSTEYLATNGMIVSPSKDSLNQWSTQAAVAIAQKSLQDDLTSPNTLEGDKGQDLSAKSPKDLTRKVMPDQIKPFQSFSTPQPQNSSSGDPPTCQGQTSTQAMINGISPYKFSTEKKVQFGDRSNDGEARAHKQHELVECEQRRCSASPQEPEATRPTSARSNEGPTTTLPVALGENFSVESTGTALPFTLTASTNETRQQDGQGFIAGFDNFDLDQAIADAGSFLQSWELHADISFKTDRSGATSIGQPARSILRANSARNP
ncbi:predicted protein [Uncinocarpus reesii 1704]|uniref:Uncharacterized protein n=1 Tax=Uncinocarpus reesii (strain UAMH 1704) TaxID=336963 RepID=C4JQ99_UNCRE|nr:uncharacterized protein UREG_04653 [Uncinocarpus reesii 1704]EEP79807.1 predicted protein [Uncinocarpus reesii 1704]